MRQVETILRQSLAKRSQMAFFHSDIHTVGAGPAGLCKRVCQQQSTVVAPGYHELVWGDSRSKDVWRSLVATADLRDKPSSSWIGSRPRFCRFPQERKQSWWRPQTFLVETTVLVECPWKESEVCTLGRNIGAILFMDGRRVRNSPLNELYTSTPGEKSRQVWVNGLGTGPVEGQSFP